MRPSQIAGAGLFACFLWDINDGSGPKGVPNANFFLAAFAFLLLVAIWRRRSCGQTVPSLPIVLLWGCLTVGFLTVPLRDDFSLPHVLSDVGTLAFASVAIFYAAVYLSELSSDWTLRCFSVGYTVVALWSYFAAVVQFRPGYWWNGRWDPPYFLLFAALALLATEDRSRGWRWFGASALLPCAWLSLGSGNRTQLILGLFFVFIVLFRRSLYAIVIAILAAATALLVSSGALKMPFAGLLQDSRFGLLRGGADASLSGRSSEVHDVLLHFSRPDSFVQGVLGFGHGASWEPITRSIDGLVGELYYIHVGPIFLLYRYGVFGIALFVYWFVTSVRALLRFRSGVKPGLDLWLLGAVGFSANLLLQNSLYDPPAVLAMAVASVAVWRNAPGQGREFGTHLTGSGREERLGIPVSDA